MTAATGAVVAVVVLYAAFAIAMWRDDQRRDE